MLRLMDLLEGLDVRAQKMFGEYAIYCGTKLPALLADDQLFVKVTPSSRAILDESHDAPPYPGAKLHICVPKERWDDAQWLKNLIQGATDDLPEPKPKKPRGQK